MRVPVGKMFAVVVPFAGLLGLAIFDFYDNPLSTGVGIVITAIGFVLSFFLINPE